MTKLAEAVATHNVTPADFARRIGVSRGHGHDLLSGRRRATPALALLIEREFLIPADTLNAAVAAARSSASLAASGQEKDR